MASSHAFSPDLLAGFCFQAPRDAAFFGHREQQVINDDRRWDVRGAPGRTPLDVGVGDIAGTGGTNGQEMTGQATCEQVNQAMVKQRTTRDIESTKVVHTPQFLARDRVVGNRRFGGRSNQLPPPTQFNQLGCRVRLLVVSGLLLFHFAGINAPGPQCGIPVGLHVAVSHPPRFPRLLVQGHEELLVDSIERHEQ